MNKKVHETFLRVRYSETDKMGVSYYANYLVWFEVARSEYFRSLGLEYTELEKEGIFLPVVEARCSYHAPTRYDDEIVVKTKVDKVGRASIAFSYEILRKKDKVLACEGFTSHTFVGRDFKPKKVPEQVSGKIKAGN